MCLLLLGALVPLHAYTCFFFNDTATTEIYTLSLHDALPISQARAVRPVHLHRPGAGGAVRANRPLLLLLPGSAAPPDHAGAVPHDLRLRTALLRGPPAPRRRRRYRRRRADHPRREGRQRPAGARSGGRGGHSI